MAARSSWVAVTHSASREIGTQTSVAKASLPGTSDFVAQNASCRACHSFCRSSSFAAHAVRATAQVFGNRRKGLGLLAGRSLGAMEFEKQRRRHLEIELRIGVEGLHMLGIDQLDARHRNAHLDCRDGGVAAGLDTGERADGGDDRFRNAIELQRHFGDDAERSLRADHQPGEIISGRRFLGARAGADDLRHWP